MGILVKQDETRSQLQTKVAADLAERMNKKTLDPTPSTPPPAILDNQRQTGRFAWVWLVLGVVVLGALVAFVLN